MVVDCREGQRSVEHGQGNLSALLPEKRPCISYLHRCSGPVNLLPQLPFAMGC